MNGALETESRHDEEGAADHQQGASVDTAFFSYLPTDPQEYADLEKTLKQKIDWTLMPVLVAMIVLKYA